MRKSSTNPRSRMTDPSVNGDCEVNDESKVEKVYDQDMGSTDAADCDLKQRLKPNTPSEIAQRICSIQGT